MKMAQMECFLAVYRSGSFTKAGEELFLSQQAVSRYIQDLENELSVKLFERGIGRSHPTAQGDKLKAIISQMLDEVSRARDINARLCEAKRSTFRIGYFTRVNPFGFLFPGVREFRERHRSTRFSGIQDSYDRLIALLAEGEIDVALIPQYELLKNSELYVYERIIQENACVYLPKDGAKGGCKLLRCSYSLDMEPIFEKDIFIKRLLRETDVETAEIVEAPNSGSFFEELRNGRYATVLNEKTEYSEWFADCEKKVVYEDNYLYCVYHLTNDNPLITEFSAFLKDYYADKA